MAIQNINPNTFNTLIAQKQTSTTAPIATVQPTETKEIKQDPITSLLDKFGEKTVNPADINDTIKVPRTIFKGYLCFFLGTSTGTLAGLAKNVKWLSTSLKVATAALTSLGTFEFVKPYLIKGESKKASN